MTNLTLETAFLLWQFSDNKQFQVFHGFLFLLIYLEALIGNLLIFLLVTVDRCLHSPMYFFLKNLSFFDAGLISVTVLNLILNAFTHKSKISFPLCVCQVFASSELFLLTAMSYDRYVAICHPLHYDVIMNKGVCVLLTAVSWLFGRNLLIFTLATMDPSLHTPMKHIITDISVSMGIMYAFLCLVCIGYSYIYIFNTVLRIPSLQGQSKPSPPHLLVTFTVTFTATGHSVLTFRTTRRRHLGSECHTLVGPRPCGKVGARSQLAAFSSKFGPFQGPQWDFCRLGA
ncbi:olfactory receptor 14A16-like [Thomomys bottae]